MSVELEGRRAYIAVMGGRTREHVALPVVHDGWTIRRVRPRRPVVLATRPHLVSQVYEVSGHGLRMTRTYFLCGGWAWGASLAADSGDRQVCSRCVQVRLGLRIALVKRGTSNSDVRGNSMARRRRKQFLIDRDGDGVHVRCCRCGRLLDITTVNVDRIVPGRDGGTYRRENIRPSCSACGTETGNELKKETPCPNPDARCPSNSGPS